MTTSQPRQPKGQPVGGQFAGKQQSGDEVANLVEAKPRNTRDTLDLVKDRDLCRTLFLDIDEEHLDSGDTLFIRLTPIDGEDYTVQPFDYAGNRVGRSWLAGGTFNKGEVPPEFVSTTHKQCPGDDTDLWIDVDSVMFYDTTADDAFLAEVTNP